MSEFVLNEEYITSSYAYKNPTKIYPHKKKQNTKKYEAYKKLIIAQVNLLDASKEYTNAYEEAKRLKNQ